MSYEVSDFNKEVIEASHSTPVLVDFWAPWCGPCRVLSPTLEKLAAEAAGAWSLVTVNTDENPSLAMSYQVRGIPAVKLFSDGRVVAEFTGAMPEYAIRQWLDQQIPSEADKGLAAVQTMLSENRTAEALKLLEELQSEPGAKLLLAATVVLEDPQRALELIETVETANAADDQVKSAVQIVGTAIAGLSTNGLPDGPGKEDFRQALSDLAQGNVSTAIEGLMNVLLKDRYYSDDAARKIGVALFTLLGDAHPVTRKLRRTFDMYLY